MKWVFWGASGLIAYTYLGYAGWLWLRSRWRPRPVQRATYLHDISIVMVVRNEEDVLSRKIHNLLQMNYPPDQLEVVLVSDGSSDATEKILAEKAARDSRVQVLVSSETRGKASCLNDAIGRARGEIVIFADARQEIEFDAVRLLMENFADPAVGCVSGELMLGSITTGEACDARGLYWRIEKMIREMESASGSVVGATGALYAVRRTFLVNLPGGTILDDVYIPMNVARQGARVVFDKRARAWDLPNLGMQREFGRKVRTLTGNYQLVQLEPWLLSGHNPIRFEFISHKLLRLVVPFALAATLISSFFLPEAIYRIALFLQLAFYSLGVLGMARLRTGPLAKVAGGAFTFVMLNTAAIFAFSNFVSGRKPVWIR